MIWYSTPSIRPPNLRTRYFNPVLVFAWIFQSNDSSKFGETGGVMMLPLPPLGFTSRISPSENSQLSVTGFPSRVSQASGDRNRSDPSASCSESGLAETATSRQINRRVILAKGMAMTGWEIGGREGSRVYFNSIAHRPMARRLKRIPPPGAHRCVPHCIRY